MKKVGLLKGLVFLSILVFLLAAASCKVDAPAPSAPPPATPLPVATTPAALEPAAAPALAAPAPALTTPAPAAVPAMFVTSELRIYPEAIVQGDNVTVSVKVTNTGGQTGTYTVVLKIQNEGTKEEDIKTQDVSLDAGTSKKVVFVIPEVMGGYKVTVDQLTGKIALACCPIDI